MVFIVCSAWIYAKVSFIGLLACVWLRENIWILQMFILEVNVHISVTVTECNRDHTGLVICWRAINSCHEIPASCSTWLLLSSASMTVTDPLGSHVL